MYLTVSKKFEISFSHRLFRPQFSEENNHVIYGKGSKGEHGHGHNAVVTFLFNGPIETDTGMMINVTTIKERINKLLAQRYDHKFLNLDTPPFTNMVPTFENIAKELLKDSIPLFVDHPATPVVCHLFEDPEIDVTAYDSGSIERSYHLDFSAARRTWSPHLSDIENEQLFGVSSRESGHGHHYRLRFTFDEPVDSETGLMFSREQIQPVLGDIYERFDHRNMNTDIPEFKNQPVTTESMARFFFEEVSKKLPLNRVRLNENDYFFVEYHKDKTMYMGVKTKFHAAHRLHSDKLSEEENLDIYGKCHNPNGHGHTYKVEILLNGRYDEKSGTLYNLLDVLNKLEQSYADWDYKHLNLETDAFKDTISTGENIISVLWERLVIIFGDDLSRLSLWETPNNRFTIRKEI